MTPGDREPHPQERDLQDHVGDPDEPQPRHGPARRLPLGALQGGRGLEGREPRLGPEPDRTPEEDDYMRSTRTQASGRRRRGGKKTEAAGHRRRMSRGRSPMSPPCPKKLLGQVLKETGALPRGHDPGGALRSSAKDGGQIGQILVRARPCHRGRHPEGAGGQQAGLSSRRPVGGHPRIPRRDAARSTPDGAHLRGRPGPRRTDGTPRPSRSPTRRTSTVLDDLRFMTGCEVRARARRRGAVEGRHRAALRGEGSEAPRAARRPRRPPQTAAEPTGGRGGTVDLADAAAMANSAPVVKLLQLHPVPGDPRPAPPTSTSSRSSSDFKIRYRVDGVALRARGAAAPPGAGADLAASRSWRTSTSPRRACRRTAASSSRSAAAPVDLRVSHAADDVRRVLRDARPRPRASSRSTSTSSACATTSSTLIRRLTGAAARHRAGHRADGFGQDDDALLRACNEANDDRPEDHHDRGPGRVRPRRASSRSRSTRRSASPTPRCLRVDPAPGPGHDPGRRDPRPRDGADRDRGVAHRPRGLLDRCTPTTPRSRSRAWSTSASSRSSSRRRLEAVVAQRLVRKVCDRCKRLLRAERRGPDGAGAEPGRGLGKKFAYGKGCADCHFTGYRGRTAIFEIMRVSERIRQLIMDNVPTSRIREAALEEGMRTLRESGLLAIFDGITTIEEVVRETIATM